MKLTTKGRYAVMALADLAARNVSRPVPLADIADRQDISLSYLEQLFARMRRSGLVKSVRGPGGGYLLGRDEETIAIADIVRAVEEDGRTMQCAPNDPRTCHCVAEDGPNVAEACATHDLWQALGDEVESFLSGVTLADVLTGRLRPQTPAARAEMLATGE